MGWGVGGGREVYYHIIILRLYCIEKSYTLVRYINFLTEILCICSKEEGK